MSEATKNLVATLSREVIDPVIALLFTLALVYFIYGVVQFIANADNQETREEGKKHLLYSVIGLVIMAGVWGIIELIITSLGIDSDPVQEYDQLSGYF